MNDNIFDEITADLRRERLADAWTKYGRYVIATAVGIVLLVAMIIGIGAYRDSQQAAASLRYDALQTQLAEADADEKIVRLLAFGEAEHNGYGALAQLAAALGQAEQGQYDNALMGFDGLIDNGALPDSMQDFAALQAGIVLLDSGGSLDEIERRLDDLLDDDNRLLPMAREVMALAYSSHDKPLEARDLLMQQIGDAGVSSLSRARAEIMLQNVKGGLLALPLPLPEADAEEKGDQ